MSTGAQTGAEIAAARLLDPVLDTAGATIEKRAENEAGVEAFGLEAEA